MPGLTNFAENALINHFFRGINYTPPTDIYFGLCRAEPADDGTGGNEPTGLAGYARVLVTFGSFASRQILNNILLSFTAGVDWGPCPHGALFDAASAGNMLFSTGSISSPGTPGLSPVPTMNGGATLTIPAGDVIVRIDADPSGLAGASPYTVQRMLELMFKNTAHAGFSTRKAHLATTSPTPDGAGGVYLAAGDYTPQDANFAVFDQALGESRLAADVVFRNAGSGGAWGTLPAWALFNGTNPAVDNQLWVAPIVPVPNIGANAAMALSAASTSIR